VRETLEILPCLVWAPQVVHGRISWFGYLMSQRPKAAVWFQKCSCRGLPSASTLPLTHGTSAVPLGSSAIKLLHFSVQRNAPRTGWEAMSATGTFRPCQPRRAMSAIYL